MLFMITVYWKLQDVTTYNFLSVWASGLANLLPRIIKELASFFFSNTFLSFGEFLETWDDSKYNT